MVTLATPIKTSFSIERSVEQDILFCCARTQPSTATIERTQQLCQQSIDWSYLLHTARSHGVMPLLSQNLREHCLELLPKEIS
ncbi:MAG: hypothetical protein AAFY72_17350, partial [Cyanobacteria bacterium J06649_4]